MKEISKDRADEIDAAFHAASPTQRLSLPYMSWIASNTVTYYEHSPQPLSLKASERIAELEAALLVIYRLAISASDETDPAEINGRLVEMAKAIRSVINV